MSHRFWSEVFELEQKGESARAAAHQDQQLAEAQSRYAAAKAARAAEEQQAREEAQQRGGAGGAT